QPRFLAQPGGADRRHSLRPRGVHDRRVRGDGSRGRAGWRGHSAGMAAAVSPAMEAKLSVEASISATLSLPDAACRRWDAAIVGAGPAGAVAASTLARSGWSVLLVDRASFPRGKVCGCCLGGAALDALEQAGVFGQVRPHGAALS